MLRGLTGSGWHLCSLMMRMMFDGWLSETASDTLTLELPVVKPNVSVPVIGRDFYEVELSDADELDGYLDVDLEASAFTNAFPIHRLALDVGDLHRGDAGDADRRRRNCPRPCGLLGRT